MNLSYSNIRRRRLNLTCRIANYLVAACPHLESELPIGPVCCCWRCCSVSFCAVLCHRCFAVEELRYSLTVLGTLNLLCETTSLQPSRTEPTSGRRNDSEIEELYPQFVNTFLGFKWVTSGFFSPLLPLQDHTFDWEACQMCVALGSSHLPTATRE